MERDGAAAEGIEHDQVVALRGLGEKTATVHVVDVALVLPEAKVFVRDARDARIDLDRVDRPIVARELLDDGATTQTDHEQSTWFFEVVLRDRNHWHVRMVGAPGMSIHRSVYATIQQHVAQVVHVENANLRIGTVFDVDESGCTIGSRR